MKAVGVRELKARLSRYLRDVQAGEVVLITDRGRVVAELRQPGAGAPARETEWQRRLRLLAEQVPLAVGEPHDPSFYAARPPLSLPPGAARESLDWIREDRR